MGAEYSTGEKAAPRVLGVVANEYQRAGDGMPTQEAQRVEDNNLVATSNTPLRATNPTDGECRYFVCT